MKNKKLSKLLIAGAGIAPIVGTAVSLTACSNNNTVSTFSFKDLVKTTDTTSVFLNNTLQIQKVFDEFSEVGWNKTSYTYTFTIDKNLKYDLIEVTYSDNAAGTFNVSATETNDGLIEISFGLKKQPDDLTTNFSTTITLKDGETVVGTSELKFNVTVESTPIPVVYGTDLTELTKDEIQNLPIGTKFVFDLDMYISQNGENVVFGNYDNAFYFIVMAKAGLNGVALYNKKDGAYTTDAQTIRGDAGGHFEYIYGNNGENWVNDGNFIFYIKPDGGDREDITQLPSRYEGLCKVYKPTDEGYFESETGVAITDGYLDWEEGINADGISSIHFNWDSYFSRFQVGNFDDQYFLRYEIDSLNHIDFLWNASWSEASGYTNNPGKTAIEICLPDYTEYNPSGDTIHVNLLHEYMSSSKGGHYVYTLGDWGEPTTGTFKIMNYGDEGNIQKIPLPDWSGNTWTPSSSPALDTGFVTLVK